MPERAAGSALRIALWVVAATVGIAGCALREARHAYSGSAPPDEAAVYRALVAHYQQTVETPLRIDPRPVRSDVELDGIKADDFVKGPDDRTGALSVVLRERGIEAADAIRDWRCVFTVGPPAVPGDTLRAERPECGVRAYTSVVLSAPLRLPRTADRGGLVRVRALTMTLSSYAIWNFELSPDDSGGWKIDSVRRAFVIWS